VITRIDPCRRALFLRSLSLTIIWIEVGVEVNTEKTKYMLLSRCQNAGKILI
jgi:hypothetical protein